jgi:molybdenum cofactor cytidylyltransferase
MAGQPLVCHTIAAWQRSRVQRIVVVVRPGDQELLSTIDKSNVDLVIPSVPPPDMKASLQAALRHIERQYQPTADDAFLVAPADMPRLSTAIVDRLIGEDSLASGRTILAPMIAGQRGHPVLFPWEMGALVHALADDKGLNAVVNRHAPALIPCEDLVSPNECPFADIDTPDDYRQITNDQG